MHRIKGSKGDKEVTSICCAIEPFGAECWLAKQAAALAEPVAPDSIVQHRQSLPGGRMTLRCARGGIACSGIKECIREQRGQRNLSNLLARGTKKAKGAKRARELAVFYGQRLGELGSGVRISKLAGNSVVSWRRMGGQFWKFERPIPDPPGGSMVLKGAKRAKKSRQFVVRLNRSDQRVGQRDKLRHWRSHWHPIPESNIDKACQVARRALRWVRFFMLLAE